MNSSDAAPITADLIHPFTVALDLEKAEMLTPPHQIVRRASDMRGNMVSVPGFWAHRSVNTGTQPMVSFCLYPSEAGNNYGDLEPQGFPQQIYKRHGQMVVV